MTLPLGIQTTTLRFAVRRGFDPRQADEIAPRHRPAAYFMLLRSALYFRTVLQEKLMHMLHHVSFGVAEIERSAAFYDAARAPLGYVRVWEHIAPGESTQSVGYGVAGGSDKFAIKLSSQPQAAPGTNYP